MTPLASLASVCVGKISIKIHPYNRGSFDAHSLSSSSTNPGITPTCVARMMYSPFTYL